MVADVVRAVATIRRWSTYHREFFANPLSFTGVEADHFALGRAEEEDLSVLLSGDSLTS